MVKKSFADKSRSKAAGKPRGSVTTAPPPEPKPLRAKKAEKAPMVKTAFVTITSAAQNPVPVFVDAKKLCSLRVGVKTEVPLAAVDALESSDVTFEVSK